MLKEFNLGEIERVRLVLRGGSAIDWRRLNIASVDECREILRANEFIRMILVILPAWRIFANVQSTTWNAISASPSP